MRLPDFSDNCPRALALDLDGTALNSKSEMSGRTSNAVLRLIDREFPVIIATARPERVISRLTGPEIARRSSLVQMSGASAHGRSPLHGHHRWPINPDAARVSWDIVQASPIETRMTVEVDGSKFAVSHESDANELWAFNTATPDMIISLEEAMDAGPAKVSVNGLGNDLTPIFETLGTELSDDSVAIPALDRSFINVHHVNATKSGGVSVLLKPLGVTLGETLSFGDDYPDIELLRNTGWSVAVANAITEARSAAKYQTASADDDGVAIVIESLLAALEASI